MQSSEVILLLICDHNYSVSNTNHITKKNLWPDDSKNRYPAKNACCSHDNASGSIWVLHHKLVLNTYKINTDSPSAQERKASLFSLLTVVSRESEEGSGPGEKRQMPRSIIPMWKSPWPAGHQITTWIRFIFSLLDQWQHKFGAQWQE